MIITLKLFEKLSLLLKIYDEYALYLKILISII